MLRGGGPGPGIQYDEYRVPPHSFSDDLSSSVLEGRYCGQHTVDLWMRTFNPFCSTTRQVSKCFCKDQFKCNFYFSPSAERCGVTMQSIHLPVSRFAVFDEESTAVPSVNPQTPSLVCQPIHKFPQIRQRICTLSTMPLLQYPITRTFPGRAFSYAVFAGAAVVLLFLAVVNGEFSALI